MPLRHVVCFRFVDGTSTEQVDAMAARLRELPATIAEIVDYRVGADVGVNPDSWDFAVTADFASVEDFEAYRDHPVHQEVIRTAVLPILAERAAVQITT